MLFGGRSQTPFVDLFLLSDDMRAPPSARKRTERQISLHDCRGVVRSKTSYFLAANEADVAGHARTIELFLLSERAEPLRDEALTAVRQLASMQISPRIARESRAGMIVARASTPACLDAEIRESCRRLMLRWTSNLMDAVSSGQTTRK